MGAADPLRAATVGYGITSYSGSDILVDDANSSWRAATGIAVQMIRGGL